MTDQIDTVSAIQVEGVYTSLLGVVERVRADVDKAALLAILEAAPAINVTAGRLAAMDAELGFDAGFLEELLAGKREDEPAYVADGLGTFFLAIAALAGGAIRYTVNTTDGFVRAERDRYVAVLRSSYAGATVRAALDTIEHLLTARGSAESRVRQVLRSIGLSPAQAASLNAARDVLFAYLESPMRTMPAQVVGSRTFPAQMVRKADPKALLTRAASRLSAPQRAMLLKAMTPALDEVAADKLLTRHAAKLIELRARSTAGFQTHATAEHAKLTTWRAAQRVGALPRDQRRFWQTAGDEKVRHSHAAVPSMNKAGVALDQAFVTPLGEFMSPPLEINCRCKAVLRGVPR